MKGSHGEGAGRPGAVIILECGDVEEAKSVMAELPLVKEKIIEFEGRAAQGAAGCGEVGHVHRPRHPGVPRDVRKGAELFSFQYGVDGR